MFLGVVLQVKFETGDSGPFVLGLVVLQAGCPTPPEKYSGAKL